MCFKESPHTWPEGAIVQQAVGQLPWGHNLVLLTKLKTAEQRLAYAQRAIEHGWSRAVLIEPVPVNHAWVWEDPTINTLLEQATPCAG